MTFCRMIRMKVIRMKETYSRENGLYDTWIDLVAGCLVYSMIMEVIGLIFVSNKAGYSAGLLVGTLTAAACAYSMYKSTEKAADLDQSRAQRVMVTSSILRMIFIFGVMLAAWRIRQISLAGEIVGIAGLKISAYLHVYVHVYITGPFRKKGR